MPVLHSSGYVWWIERGKLAVGTSSDNGTTVTPPSTASKVIRVYAKDVASVDNGEGGTLTQFSLGTSIDTGEFSKLPIQFHEALIAKVMEKLFRKDVEGVALATYWRNVYKEYVRDGKNYANNNRLDTGFTVAQHDM